MRRLAQRSSIHVGVAFLAMGGWAVFANRWHPWPQSLMAGVVQGALSGAITFVLKRMIERLASSFSGLAALVLPPLIAVGLSVAVLSSIHALAGTPEILATMALPVSVTAIYSTIYTAALWRARRASDG
jgi:hypothetical protein